MQVPNQFDVNAPINIGSVLQVYKVATDIDVQLPTTIAAGNTATSLAIRSGGYKSIAIGLISSQAGILNVQRYIDPAGTIPQDDGVPFSKTLTANQPESLSITDLKPFGSFKISIENTGSSSATISPFTLLLQAN
jgi:hypothetical protein